MMKKSIVLETLLLFLSTGLATAVPITGLVSTGGAAQGSLDPNWLYSPVPASTFTSPYVTQTDSTGFPFYAWLANSSASKWISPNVGYGNQTGIWGDPSGQHLFRLVFNLPSNAIAGTATFSYKIATDNSLYSVSLNGQMIQSSPAGGYTSFTGPITVGPSPGLFYGTNNVLDVIVVNIGLAGSPNQNSWNPVGLRFEILESNVDLVSEPPGGEIPEPGTMLLMAAGLGVLGLIRFRLKRP